MGQSLSSEQARSQKQQKEASRRAAPDARERIPTVAGGAAPSYHFYGAFQPFNSNQTQRPSRQSFFRTFLGQEWLSIRRRDSLSALAGRKMRGSYSLTVCSYRKSVYYSHWLF